MKKEIRDKIEEVFKEFPEIDIDEFKFVIDALAELFEAEKERWFKKLKQGKICTNCGTEKNNDLCEWCSKCLEKK